MNDAKRRIEEKNKRAKRAENFEAKKTIFVKSRNLSIDHRVDWKTSSCDAHDH